MTQNITKFQFNGNEFPVMIVDGEALFQANAVCDILDLVNPREALRRLDEDEKDVILTDTLGGMQRISYVNEAGLYTLVLSSRKPEAKQFKRWITHEVLPQIRRTGQYTPELDVFDIPANETDLLISMSDGFAIAAREIKRLDQEVKKHHREIRELDERVNDLNHIDVREGLRERLNKLVRRYANVEGIPYAEAWEDFDTAYYRQTGKRIGVRAKNRRISRPEYLERTKSLDLAVRVADEMLFGTTFKLVS